MKFRVTMKDPDTLHEAIQDAVADDVTRRLPGATADEHEVARLLAHGRLGKLASKWFEHGEYLTVEIDTEEQTCLVVPKGG